MSNYSIPLPCGCSVNAYDLGNQGYRYELQPCGLHARKHFQPDEKIHTYLGDGVYAHGRVTQIWLSCDRENGEHTIALEPQVLSALMKYAVEIGWLKKEGEWDA